ncbi:MAG: hypothetical protein M1457_06630 [bacterium]|nr:hypothetical protein [bacterium]
MSQPLIKRRDFLRIGGVAALGAVPLAKAGADILRDVPTGPQVAYRLSVRGRRGSRAAKLHNANHIFATQEAADAHRAHYRDRSRIVAVTVSAQEYIRLFGGGLKVRDLRQDAAVGPTWTLYE